MLDRFKEAIKSAKKATKLDPKNVQAWLILGDVNIRAGKSKAAMKALTRASELDPTDSTIENTMGMVSYKDGDLDDAVAHLRRSIQKDSKNSIALRNLGLILMELEEWQEAVDTLERFTKLVKDDPDMYDALATAQARLDDFCSAKSAWAKARKLYKKSDQEQEAERVAILGRAARANCSRQKKALKAEKEREKVTRRFSDRHRLREKKKDS
jgi:Flp pilus assembly protein TadD